MDRAQYLALFNIMVSRRVKRKSELKSAIPKRSVILAGHKTSISVEDAFWKGLKVTFPPTVGRSGNMLVGCGNVGAAAILLNSKGELVKTFPGLGGTDELWYDPRTNAFYVTGNNGTNTSRFFDVITDDPNGGINGDVFVPLAGTSTLNPCPASFVNPGCIAVFAPARRCRRLRGCRTPPPDRRVRSSSRTSTPKEGEGAGCLKALLTLGTRPIAEQNHSGPFRGPFLLDLATQWQHN